MDDLERKELDLRRRNEEIDARRNRGEVELGSLNEKRAGNSNSAAPCSPTKPPPGTKIPVKKRALARPSAVAAVGRSSSSSRLKTSEVTERLADEICRLVRWHEHIRTLEHLVNSRNLDSVSVSS